MNYKLIVIFLFTLSISSCSKYDINPLPIASDVDEETEVFLLSTAIHTDEEAALFEIVNSHRTSINLQPLNYDGATYYFAGKHTKYMIAQGDTSHDHFAARAQELSVNTSATVVAENVAKNYDTVEEAFKGWMHSPGHRANIEGNYTHSAINIRKNDSGDYYFTQLFFK